MKPVIRIKRVYEKRLKKDGHRILVDRLWPRGLTNGKNSIDTWAKSLAPTTHLKKWFDYDPEFWLEFQKKYRAELNKNKTLQGFIDKYRDETVITLLYATKENEYTHAIVLQNYLKERYEDL